MVVYEINLTLDPSIEAECLAWIKPHIFRTLQTPGFLQAQLFSRPEQSKTSGKKEWTVHYHIVSDAELRPNANAAAGLLQLEGSRRFGGRFSADKRLLHAAETFR